MTYSDPSGNFAIVQQAVDVIQGMWTRTSNMRQLIARYKVTAGTLIGIADRVLEKTLMGERITGGDIHLGATVGAVGGGMGHLAGRIPCHLLGGFTETESPVIRGF